MIPIILVPPVPIITYEPYAASDPNNAIIIATLTVSYCTCTLYSLGLLELFKC